MNVVSIQSRKKSWQSSRERVSVLAALAIQKETVVRRLERLREDIGHPEKPGRPLTQAQAAARVGVEARTWQRWEAGDVIPYARHLDAIATAFGFEVSEFYDEQPGGAGADADERLDRMERLLVEMADQIKGLLAQQSGLLNRQSDILEEIRGEQAVIRELVDTEISAARTLETAAASLHAAAAPTREPQESHPESPRKAS